MVFLTQCYLFNAVLLLETSGCRQKNLISISADYEFRKVYYRLIKWVFVLSPLFPVVFVLIMLLAQLTLCYKIKQNTMFTCFCHLSFY